MQHDDTTAIYPIHTGDGRLETNGGSRLDPRSMEVLELEQEPTKVAASFDRLWTIADGWEAVGIVVTASYATFTVEELQLWTDMDRAGDMSPDWRTAWAVPLRFEAEGVSWSQTIEQIDDGNAEDHEDEDKCYGYRVTRRGSESGTQIHRWSYGQLIIGDG